MQISRLSRELDEVYGWYERERALRPGAYNAAGSYPAGLNSIPREMSGLETRIHQIHDEIEAIDRVISEKWKQTKDPSQSLPTTSGLNTAERRSYRFSISLFTWLGPRSLLLSVIPP